MAKKEKTIIHQINEWFEGDRNYKEGINLLEEAAPNMRAMIKHLKRAETTESIEHLSYQLFKISDHTDENICNSLKKKKADKKQESKKPVDKEIPTTTSSHQEISKSTDHEIISAFIPDSLEDKDFWSKIILRQKKYYNMRAMSHKNLVLLGDSNAPEIVADRKILLETINDCGLIVDFLHNQKLAWANSGLKPEASILNWVPEEISVLAEIPKMQVDEIPAVDLQSELAKVRSRLSKYPSKLKKFSGKKLDVIIQKKAEDEKLKEDLIKQIDAVRNK